MEIDRLNCNFTELSMKFPVKLGGLVDAFPDEICEDILRRLPLAARCRFRCVCTKWRILLSSNFSSLPSTQYTFLSAPDEREAMFFCHAESKWFQVPCVPLPSTGPKWVVEDVQDGFVCYLRKDELDCYGEPTQVSLAISNPAMQSFQIFPFYPQDAMFTFTKLWVDRQNGTFKVIVLSIYPSVTEVFDSVTSRWDRFDCEHDMATFNMGGVEFFFLNNIAYIHCFYEAEDDDHVLKQYRYECSMIFALDMECREWRTIDPDFPGRECFPMQYTIITRDKDLLLVQICLEAGTEFLSVWKLLYEPSETPDFSKWENIVTVSDMPAPNLAIHPRHIYYGDAYIFFVLDGNESPQNMAVPVYAKYTFATKAWSLTSFPKKKQCNRVAAWYKSFEWKPSLDMEVKLHNKEL